MGAQIVEIDGRKIAMLPIEDYERLVGLAEERADIIAAERAEERRLAGEEYVPSSLMDRILDGQNALRVWRQYRGLTLQQLAVSVGIGNSYLSDLERGHRQGKPAVWRKLADALNVSVDDILPDE